MPEVLDTLVRKELEIQNSEGCFFTLRIVPYRTVDNIIDGVVLTFVDITENRNYRNNFSNGDILPHRIKKNHSNNKIEEDVPPAPGSQVSDPEAGLIG